ncbi:hypothetical protein AB0J82_19395 [Asanoa sp. NPDC049518]|uniref:hypothetical protein n=1 Tax=unclassified Asanoa TaxID=2685164 RepID=UPI0034265E6D
MSKTVAVILDDEHWFWAYDVSLAVLSVELMRLLDLGTSPAGLGLDDLRSRLLSPVLVPGTLGLDLVDLADPQRERLVALSTEAGQLLRARPSIAAAEAVASAARYVPDVGPDLLRGATFVEPGPVAVLADAVVALVRGKLPPLPPGTTAWLYGWHDGPMAL